MGDFWVFGYGSLIWRPGFEALERQKARVFGLHRSLCVYSWVHRGTRERPGLVFGLDRGGSCHGLAYKVAGKNREAVVSYLREREMVTNVYREHDCLLALNSGEKVRALTYVIDRSHPQYAGKLDLERQVEIIVGARGQSGENPDYVLSTAQHLETHGIRDRRLDGLSMHLKNASV